MTEDLPVFGVGLLCEVKSPRVPDTEKINDSSGESVPGKEQHQQLIRLELITYYTHTPLTQRHTRLPAPTPHPGDLEL